MLSPIFSLLAPHLAWGSWCCFLVDTEPSLFTQTDNPSGAGVGLTLKLPILSGIRLDRRVIGDEDQESQQRKEEEEPGLCWNSLNSNV